MLHAGSSRDDSSSDPVASNPSQASDGVVVVQEGERGEQHTARPTLSHLDLRGKHRRLLLNILLRPAEGFRVDAEPLQMSFFEWLRVTTTTTPGAGGGQFWVTLGAVRS